MECKIWILQLLTQKAARFKRSLVSVVLPSVQYVMLCEIWYHLYNLKNMKNTYGGVLLLVCPATLLK